MGQEPEFTQLKMFSNAWFNYLLDTAEWELNEDEVRSIKSITFEQMYADVFTIFKTNFCMRDEHFIKGKS